MLAEKIAPEAAKTVGKIVDVVKAGVTTGAGTAAVTAAQTGGDVEQTKTAGVIGAVAGVGGKLLEAVGKPIADSLQKSALNLPPQKSADLGSKLDSTASWITDNIGAGTPTSQYTKTANKVNEYEGTLQNFLKTDAKDVTVKKDDVITKLEALKGQFNDERDALAIDKQIDEVIKTIKAKQPENIPVASLNTLKRSTYTNAYNKAGTKVVDWIEAYVGNTFKSSIEDATKGMKINGTDIGSFNQEYGNALQAKGLLKIAKGKQTGLSGKALLLLLGSPAGLPGEAAGLLLGGSSGVAGAIQTGIGSLAKSAGETTPTLAKTGLGMFQGITSPTSKPQQSQ